MCKQFNMPKEEFYDIPGMDGYKASKSGNIMGYYKRVMSTKPHGDYLFVQMCINDKNVGTAVHIIIAKTFLDNPNNYTFVRHKNGNLHDNNVTNLKWCDFIYKKKEGEIFKGIKDWDNYHISNFGNVLSMNYGVLLKIQKEFNYYSVSLKKQIDDKPKTSSSFFIHQLVAEYFINNDNPELLKLIKHKDGDLLNNHHENLIWVEQFYAQKEGEIFVDVKGFENYYKISNFGNVLIKSLGELAKLGNSGDYYGICLHKKKYQ